MTHLYVPWLIRSDSIDSFICAIWLFPAVMSGLVTVCDMNHSDMRHVSFGHAARLIHIRATTHSYTCHDSFLYVPWLIPIRALTHPYICHDSLSLLPRLCPASVWHSSCSAWHNPFICVIWLLTRMTWLMTHSALQTVLTAQCSVMQCVAV